ncbi:hypothetical protein Hanom_Chr03g00203871 [Helianthus anomalus]
MLDPCLNLIIIVESSINVYDIDVGLRWGLKTDNDLVEIYVLILNYCCSKFINFIIDLHISSCMSRVFGVQVGLLMYAHKVFVKMSQTKLSQKAE